MARQTLNSPNEPFKVSAPSITVTTGTTDEEFSLLPASSTLIKPQVPIARPPLLSPIDPPIRASSKFFPTPPSNSSGHLIDENKAADNDFVAVALQISTDSDFSPS